MTALIELIDKIPLLNKAVIREGNGRYKIYLDTRYNELWEQLSREKRRVDVIIVIRDR